jgi:hypothetical protein
MKLVRKLHLWMGMLFAPSILFFALSGAFQICGLHEDDGPAWIARLALVHKDQLRSAPRRPPRPPEAAPKADAAKPEAARPASPPRERAHPSQPLKAFFLLMSLDLMVSIGLGSTRDQGGAPVISMLETANDGNVLVSFSPDVTDARCDR